MPIPTFNHDGILPPFTGENGPAGSQEALSPYAVSVMEVAATLATSFRRIEILKGWLNHRIHLRQIGVSEGFQWIDGSFVEDKNPNDIDVVNFAYYDHDRYLELRSSHPNILVRAKIRPIYHVDFLECDLNGSPEAIVNTSSYFLALFSHRRDDMIWKGMLKVPLDCDEEDRQALDFLNQKTAEYKSDE